MGLLNVERVSAYAIHSQPEKPWMFPPGSGRTRIRQLLAFMEQLEGGGDVAIEKAIDILKPGSKIISLTGPLDAAFARARGLNVLLRLLFGLMSRKIRSNFLLG